MNEAVRLNEAQIKEIENKTEQRLRAERMQGAAWEAELKTRISTLEQEMSDTLQKKEKEIEELGRAAQVLRMELGRAMTQIEEKSTEVTKMRVAVVEKEGALAEAHGSVTRLKQRVAEAVEQAKGEREQLIKRLQVQADESAARAESLRTEARKAHEMAQEKMKEMEKRHHEELSAIEERVRMLVSRKEAVVQEALARAEAAERELASHKQLLEAELSSSLPPIPSKQGFTPTSSSSSVSSSSTLPSSSSFPLHSLSSHPLSPSIIANIIKNPTTEGLTSELLGLRPPSATSSSTSTSTSTASSSSEDPNSLTPRRKLNHPQAIPLAEFAAPYAEYTPRRGGGGGKVTPVPSTPITASPRRTPARGANTQGSSDHVSGSSGT